MVFTQFEHLLREFGFGLRRSIRGHLAPVMLMAVALFVLGLFIVGTINLQETIRLAQEKVGITVFLHKGVEEETRTELVDLVSRLGGIRDVSFVSEEEALRMFRQNLGRRSYLLEGVDGNPLPGSIELTLFDDWKFTDRMSILAVEIRKMEGVESVVYGENWISSLERWIYFFVAMDLFLGIVLGLSTLLVVGNTMKLAIEARRDTIQVLRLIGARNIQIRIPFMLEGAFLGFLSSGLALFFLERNYQFAVQRLSGVLFLDVPSIAGFFLLGGVLGGGGALLSLRKYLKVERS